MQDAQSQLLAVQSEAAQVQKAKAMMDVESMRISQRIEILNNVATQATLLAGSSIAFLGGEALETVDDHDTMWHIFLRICYVGCGALALVMSLWVIVISSHLVALTRDASLRKNIIKASRLLDEGLKEVRGIHFLAMGALLFACLAGALLNMSHGMAAVVCTIFAACGVQIVMKQQFLSLQFFEQVELELDVAATGSIRDLWGKWLEPMSLSNVRRIGRMWREEERRLEEWEHHRQSTRQRMEMQDETRMRGPHGTIVSGGAQGYVPLSELAGGLGANGAPSMAESSSPARKARFAQEGTTA